MGTSLTHLPINLKVEPSKKEKKNENRVTLFSSLAERKKLFFYYVVVDLPVGEEIGRSIIHET